MKKIKSKYFISIFLVFALINIFETSIFNFLIKSGFRESLKIIDIIYIVLSIAVILSGIKLIADLFKNISINKNYILFILITLALLILSLFWIYIKVFTL